MTNFIVAGTQRTGTTLMVTLLDSHPDVLCIGESFNFSWKSNNIYQKEYSYSDYYRSSLVNYVKHITHRKAFVENYLDSFYKKTDYKSVGFKFMQSHTDRFPMVAPYLIKNNVHVVHIVRENELSVLVSLRSALARGRFHSDTKLSIERINIPVKGLIESLNKIRYGNQYWAKVFEHNTAYIKVSYHSFIENRNTEINRILDFLNLKQIELETPLVKLNPNEMALFVENFEEVSEYLGNTEFSNCLTS